jgi:hypothetical protein
MEAAFRIILLIEVLVLAWTLQREVRAHHRLEGRDPRH